LAELGADRVILYFSSGRAPGAGSDSPMPLEKLIARTARRAKIRKEMADTVLIEGEYSKLRWRAPAYTGKTAPCVTGC